MGEERHAADVAALERISSQLFRGYGSRCAARATGAWALGADGVSSMTIREGMLAREHDGSTWFLSCVWRDHYGVRMLAQGSREHVERYALDVAIHGPPGGPEFRGQRGWHCLGDDETLHLAAIGGEFRLMPLLGGSQLLMFARNDAGLCVLGIGEPEELQRSAHERLQHFRGDALHVRLGKERIVLRGVGAAGVLGHVELFDGAKLMLGHMTGDYFGLYLVRGDEPRECLNFFKLGALRQGDLGQVLSWSHQHGEDDDGVAEPEEVRARPTSAPSPPKPPPRIARLAAADLRLIDRHLAVQGPAAGPGATAVPGLLGGIAAMARLGLSNQLMRKCDLRRVLKARFGIEFHCCTKTFGRAVAAVAARTRLLILVGKRVLLRFGDLLLVDSELLREIASITLDEEVAPASTASSGAARPQAPWEASDAAAAPSMPRASEPKRSGPRAADEREGTRSPGAASGPPAGGHATVPPDPQPAEDPVDLSWLLGNREHRWYQRRSDGRVRATMSSLPAEQSASRWSGRKRARDPPDE